MTEVFFSHPSFSSFSHIVFYCFRMKQTMIVKEKYRVTASDVK